MRDERPRPNGRRPAPNGRPSLSGVPALGGPFTKVLPADGDGPLDLVAVQADDELVGALSARAPGGRAAGAPPPSGSDDRLVALLTAWRAEIDAEPIPELVDLDDAVAAVLAGVRDHEGETRRRRSGRLRHLAPLAAAAAVIVATVTGVGLGSQDAMPGDTLWAIQKVVNPERAESVEAKVAVEGHLQKVRTALERGDTVTAAQELAAIRAEVSTVRGEEGQPLLLQEQEFLAAKLAETPPGIPADLSTPPRSNPAARSTGAPPAPAAVLPPADRPAPASGAPSPGAPEKPVPPAGDPADPADPVSPGGGPAGDGGPGPGPDTTGRPDAPAPDPEPGPQPDGEGTPDPDPPASTPSGGDPAPGGGADPGTTTTAGTATGSGSEGASVAGTTT